MAKKVFLILSFLISSVSYADFGTCNTMFPDSHLPLVNLQNVQQAKTRELCFDSFATLYSVTSKTPVYSVERLSYLRINSAHEKRTNHFHEEPRLRQSERSTLADYARSGFDRGHMAPAADMPNPVAMEESFSLANMVPQAPKNNRGVWAKNVEKATRLFVKRAGGDVYVFTGPYFSPAHRTIGSGKVWVPDALFKLVYDKASGRSWVFWVENTNDAKMSKPITYEELVSRTGIRFLK